MTGNPFTGSFPDEKYCYCQKSWVKEIDPRMVACDKCDKWYHQICVGIETESTMKGKYVCCFCEGEKVPLIFEDTESESDVVDSESSDEQSIASTESEATHTSKGYFSI